MVLAYKHQGATLFLLIGGTALIVHALFRRMNNYANSLQNRIDELSVLNKVSSIISGSLDRATLFRNLAVTTLDLVGQSSRCMFGLSEEEGEFITYRLYDESGDCYRTVRLHRSEGLSGWVMQNRQGLILGDVSRQYSLYVANTTHRDAKFLSWMGVPLVVYGEVVGVLSVQNERRHSYTINHMRILTIIADQAAVALENSRLYELATIDSLTGLFVRRYFDQRFQDEWARAKRYETHFTVGLLDLDNFKQLNDTYGHQFGDQVLRETARVVRKNMRSFDVAARYGGEEFAFILPRTRAQDALVVSERIRQDIASLRLTPPENTKHAGAVRLTGSIGIASCPRADIKNAAEVLAYADEALYRAKAAGKNRVFVSAERPQN